MKPLFLLLTGISLVAVVSANAESSSTPVIGFYKFDVPPGTSAWTCGFVTKKEYQGSMTSAVPGTAKSTITVAGTPFPAALDLHYIEILSGAQQGLILDVDPATLPTSNTITVLGNIGPSGFALTGTETFCLRKHATLGTILKNGGGLNAFADTVTIFDSAGIERVAAFDGSNWVEASGFSENRNNEIIYPGQGFLINSGGTGVVTIGGGDVAYVKGGPLKIPVYGSVFNLLGVVTPLVSTNPSDTFFVNAKTQVNQLGLAGSLSPFADVVNFFAADGAMSDAASYGYDGSAVVYSSDFSTPAGAETVRNGIGFSISASSDGIYTQPQLTP